VQHMGRVVSLPQATATASTAMDARAGMRIELKIPRGGADVPPFTAVPCPGRQSQRVPCRTL
jgi:hypothetical protein